MHNPESVDNDVWDLNTAIKMKTIIQGTFKNACLVAQIIYRGI